MKLKTDVTSRFNDTLTLPLAGNVKVDGQGKLEIKSKEHAEYILANCSGFQIDVEEEGATPEGIANVADQLKLPQLKAFLHKNKESVELGDVNINKLTKEEAVALIKDKFGDAGLAEVNTPE